MRFISLADAQPGMVLACDIQDTIGQMLIGHGCVLTLDYIRKLQERGYQNIYIDDELTKDIDVEDVISRKLRQEGQENISRGDIDGCLQVAKDIVYEILNRGKITFDMADLRSVDNYSYAHSVNVAVLCGAMGVGMGYGIDEMINLVTAALLHDLGKQEIPLEILNKEGPLTSEEFEIMKTHSQLSYRLLGERDDLSAHVKAAVLLHHENQDGSGYPRGLVGDDIPMFARIIHVADVYDALTSKRTYKEPYAPNEAAEYLMGACGIMFDITAVEMLLKYVPLYPKGSEVLLSNGQRAIIFENSGVHNLRPIVKLMDGSRLDLAQSDMFNITIVGTGLDIQKPNEENEKRRKEQAGPIAKKRLMVVDDMKTNLQMIRSFLDQEYELVLLKSGQQALNYLLRNDLPDLILMDIDMPEMDGIETTRRIRNMLGDEIPILFVTALSDRETVLKCKEMHAAGYIVRPYKPVFVKSEIERIIMRWSY